MLLLLLGNKKDSGFPLPLKRYGCMFCELVSFFADFLQAGRIGLSGKSTVQLISFSKSSGCMFNKSEIFSIPFIEIFPSPFFKRDSVLCESILLATGSYLIFPVFHPASSNLSYNFLLSNIKTIPSLLLKTL